MDTGGSWCPAGSGTSVDERELAIAVRRLRLGRIGEIPGGPRQAEALQRLAASLVAPSDRQGFVFRLIRRLRRLALGWEIHRRVAAVEELAASLVRLEEALSKRERLLDQRLAILARADAEDREDVAAFEEEWRADFARYLARFDRPGS